MEYLLKSTFIISLFYLFYILFLQKDTFFQSIRFYFIIGMITALAIPFITIKKYVFVEPILHSGLLSINGTQTIQDNTLSIGELLTIAYFIGVVFFSVKFLIQLGSLLWFLYDNPKSKKGKYTFVYTSKNIAPFSVFRYIVLNPEDFDTNELDQIIAHEKIHASQFHSIDNFLIQILAIFNWFNPFVWLYTKEIQKNLEFIADEFAQSIAPKENNYQHLLLKTISPHYQLALTTNFYNSLIKKRIDMLQKNRSNKTMQFKFLLIIPMLIAFVFTFNTKVIAQKKDEWKIEIKTDRVDYFEIITKDTKNHELDKMKENFAKSGTKFKFKKLKRNNKGEITGISITVKNKSGNEAKLSQQSDKPISPIKINDNLTTGELSIGNASEINNNHNVLFYGHSNENNSIHINNSKKGVSISENNSKVISSGGDNSYVIVTDDDGKNKTITVTVDDDKNVQFGNSENKSVSVWVSDENDTPTLSMGGDKKKSYTYTIKRVGGEHDIYVGTEISSDTGSKTIYISDGKASGDSTKIKTVKIIETDDDINASQHKHENKMIISSNGEKPLIIIDGKETKEDKLEDMSPDKIESMNVLKGESAIKKYGDKGKNGVIEIITKK